MRPQSHSVSATAAVAAAAAAAVYDDDDGDDDDDNCVCHVSEVPGGSNRGTAEDNGLEVVHMQCGVVCLRKCECYEHVYI